MSRRRYRRRRASVAPAWPWWPAWTKMWEIGVAAPQVVAHRTHRMALGGAFPGRADRAEMRRMTTEKTEAWTECASAVSNGLWAAWLAVAASAVRPWWAVASTTPWAADQWGALYSDALRQWSQSAPRIAASALTPVHRRATANARRLGARRRLAR